MRQSRSRPALVEIPPGELTERGLDCPGCATPLHLHQPNEERPHRL